MLNEHEAHRQHVLAMVETAQRAGRSEDEIVAIMERYGYTEAAGERSGGTTLLRRLVETVRKAA